jgi:CHAD domain-containing protein
MSEGKWFSDVDPGTSLPDAARRVLTVRLQVVGKHIDSVAQAENDDPEHIHQLRVSSRRTTAALDIFADCFPPKVQRKAKKELKRLRRAAGAARDWDVFLLSLNGRSVPAKARAGLDLLVGCALGQRLTTGTQLKSNAQEYSKDFGRFSEHLVAAIYRQEDQVKLQTLSSLPSTALFPLVRALDDTAGLDLSDPDNLHQVRIAGKRLRYAMEILAGCFTPSYHEDLYPKVETMQEILGRANDSRFAIARMDELNSQLERSRPVGWKRKLAAFAEFRSYHQRRMSQERLRFERWYRSWKKSGGEPAFIACLQTASIV